MKAEIKKTKSFDITSFETLDVNGNSVLKGGFSVVHSENMNAGGLFGITINISKCNTVSGCGCVEKAQ